MQHSPTWRSARERPFSSAASALVSGHECVDCRCVVVLVYHRNDKLTIQSKATTGNNIHEVKHTYSIQVKTPCGRNLLCLGIQGETRHLAG